MHKDLIALTDFIATDCLLLHSIPVAEKESIEYGAYTLNINRFIVKFRAAKITPTKTGQFVTLWKRESNGPIQPFDIADGIDFFIISTRTTGCFGLFIFPATVLLDRKIISGNHSEGKRAMRVYPPWDLAANAQAKKTQQWQLHYFIQLNSGNDISEARDFFLQTINAV